VRLACQRALVSLQQRSAGLPAAAGLELEEHLHGCVDCRAAANLLDGLHELHDRQLQPLGAGARQALIARALDAALPAGGASPARPGELLARAGAPGSRELDPGGRVVRASGRTVRTPAVWAIASAAAALALVVWGVSSRRAAPEATAHLQPTAARTGGDSAPRSGTAPAAAEAEARAGADPDPRSGAAPGAADVEARTPGASAGAARSEAARVLAGRVKVGRQLIGPGQPLRAAEEWVCAGPARLAFGPATLQLSAASRGRWNPRSQELQLSAGSAVVHVDPALQRRFSVATARFSAVVLGTKFEISPLRVRVREGRVRVIDPSGRELALLDKTRPLFELSDAGPDPDGWLARAREEISKRQLAAARRSLARALALPASPEQRAEARALQAECALVAGEFAAARDGYLSVVNEFPELPAAETALFAAARIEAQHGQPARASELLQRYLTRHPAGRFAKEAGAHLQRVRSAAAAPARRPTPERSAP
jgi:hypothetical protein